MLSLHYLVYTALLTLSPVLASSNCTTQVLRLHELNYNLSREEGATIETITAATVASAKECASKCCQELEGNCTIGMFNSFYDQQNCLLIICEPLSACSFQVSKNNVDLAVVTRSKQLTTVPPKQTNDSSEKDISVEAKSSVTSNLTSLGTADASSDKDPGFLLLAQNITAVNSSSQPSVVGNFSENHEAKQNFIATEENVTTNASNNKSNLKLNSNLSTTTTAAVKENASSVLISTSTFASSTSSIGNTLDVDKKKGSKPRKGVLFNENNDDADLQNIFKEDNNETDIDQPSDTSLTGKEASSSNNTNNDRIISAQNKIVATTDATASNASTSKISLPAIEPRNETNSTASTEAPELNTNSSEFFKPSASVESITHSTVTEVPFSLIPSSSNPLGSSKPSKASTATSKSTTVATGKSAANASFDVSLSSPSVTSLAASNGSTESPSPINVNTMTIANDSDRDEWHAKAKFHLVIALVLGLILLLTVVGLILRRIYDVWQRRHYQRMDFLVDGLYNSVNT